MEMWDSECVRLESETFEPAFNHRTHSSGGSFFVSTVTDESQLFVALLNVIISGCFRAPIEVAMTSHISLFFAVCSSSYITMDALAP